MNHNKTRIKYHLLFGAVFFFAMISQTQAQAVINNNPNAKRPYSLVEVNSPGNTDMGLPMVIQNVKLIDGLGNNPINNATVVIEGNRITAVGKANSIEIPSEAEVVDGSGKTLMPGLLDAHLHTLNNNKTLFTFLSHGVTSLRDPGHPFHFYQAMQFADHVLPRAFLTGAHFDGFPAVYPDHGLMIKDVDHARQMVLHHVEKGSSAIKVYFRLPLEYYETVVSTAERYHIPVIGHLELVDADDAILAGMTGIEHVTSFGTAIAEPSEARSFKEKVSNNSSACREGRFRLWSTIDLESERVKNVIKIAADNKAYLCPTLATFERQRGDDKVEPYEAKAFENMVKFVGMAHKAGVKIVTGSHTTGKYVDFGWAYQREMELLVQAGMTPMEVIKASTIDNAEYFRTENRLGSIEVGKLADMILIDGDPSQNIKDMYNIDRVMLNGIWVPTADIQAQYQNK